MYQQSALLKYLFLHSVQQNIFFGLWFHNPASFLAARTFHGSEFLLHTTSTATWHDIGGAAAAENVEIQLFDESSYHEIDINNYYLSRFQQVLLESVWEW